MADELTPKDDWQPLTEIGPEILPGPTEVRGTEAEKPAFGGSDDSHEDKPVLKDGWQPLQGGEDGPLETLEAPGETALKFDTEMTVEPQEDYTDEQRQDLYQKVSALSTPQKLRLATLANREVRSLLIHDPRKVVCMAVLKNQRMNESEVLYYAQRKDLSEEVISSIARDHKWQKYYPIKSAIVANPKTPLGVALNLLPHLHERDLKALARDKNVPTGLRRKAQDLRSPKKGK